MPFVAVIKNIAWYSVLFFYLTLVLVPTSLWAQSPTPAFESTGALHDRDSTAVVPENQDDERAIRRAREVTDKEFIGRPIGRIELYCDLSLCQNPVAVEQLKELSGIYVGQRFSSEAATRAQRRLAKTGFFESLEMHKEIVGSHVFITIYAQGAVLIRKVSFEGLSPPPFETELRKLLMYRPGQPYSPDQAKASAQLASFDTIFAREGYFGTNISMLVRRVDSQPHLVDVVFNVEKGEELKICDIGLRGNRAMRYSEARELLLSELSFWTRKIALMPATFTTQNFRVGRDSLIHRYREMGYVRARIVDQDVQYDYDKGCVTLLVDLVEGPLWTMEFNGNNHFSDAELTQQLPFVESGYVDAEEIARAERAIRALYETRGYSFAQVVGREIIRDNNDRSIVFEIDEGQQLQIQAVRIHGNHSIDSSVILPALGTQPYGLFDSGGYLQIDQLLADFVSIESMYRNRGFLQAMVYAYELEVHERNRGLVIHIHINEGIQTRVARVELTGARVVPQGTLLNLLSVATSDAFVPLNVHADRSRIVQRYSSYGYPLARVETTCRLLTGEEVPCEEPQLTPGCRAMNMEEITPYCSWKENQNQKAMVCERFRNDDGQCHYQGGVIEDRVRITHHIEEGPRVEVGEVFLKGNFKTKSELIYRELPLDTGDVFDVQKLLEGQANMRSLGLFDSVSIEAIGLDDGISEVDTSVDAALIISVEETRSRFLDFRFGVESRDFLGEAQRLLLTGEAQYQDTNFWGLGQRFTPRIIGAVNTLDLLQVSLGTAQGENSAQEFIELDYLFGAELIYSHPRFLKSFTNIDKLFLTITPFYLLDMVGVSNDQVLREEWGLRLELRKELSELMERLFIKMGFEAKQAATWSPSDLRIDGERVFSPRRATGKIIPELTLDKRDSPLNPRKGFYFQIQPQLVSGDALAHGAEDVIDDAYIRLLVSLNAALTAWDTVTLAQGIRVGQIVSLFDRQSLVPPDERFYLGGMGTLRGFAANSLGPIGNRQQPTGGEFLLHYNIELRYPILRNLGIYGATFFDAGILSNCYNANNEKSFTGCYESAFPDDDRLGNIRTSAGMGLRYLILNQIPLVLDYGIVLNRRPGEAVGEVHFNLGYSF